jgi:hypothetical protein
MGTSRVRNKESLNGMISTKCEIRSNLRGMRTKVVRE